MPGLRELQRDFAAAVLRRREFTGPDLGPAGPTLPRRVSVYRVNARENFAAALAAAYPVLQRELGAERFRALAWHYQDEHPSASGNLYETGRHLPEFMARSLANDPEEYLRDLARLEWAVQEAMVAADSDAQFDPRVLATLPASAYESLRLQLHPAVRLLHLDYPVFSLWQAFHATGPASPPTAGVRAAAVEDILIRRAGHGIELQQLDEVEYHCLDCLMTGGSFGDMTEAGLALAEAPDLGAMLARWAACGVITAAVPGPRPPA